MLYRKICFIGLSVYATLNRRVFGATYVEYASANTGYCANAGASDRCEFHCDQDNLERTFNCHHAAICDVYCEAKKCLTELDATGAQQLNLIGSADQCLLPGTGTVYLPSNGSANITVTSGKKPFVQSTINAGTNTEEVHIFCGVSGACANMEVNAQTAQFLYIDTVGFIFDGKDNNNKNIINCPSSYDTECIIDASNSGTVQLVEINANNTSLYISAKDGGLIKQSTINVRNASCDINIANSGVLDTSLLYIKNTLCTINATNGGSTNNAEFHTLKGYPHDVVLLNYEGDPSAKLYCEDIGDPNDEISNKDILDQNKNTCYNSRSPTLNPTNSPTSNPSQSPTRNPSLSPSHAPSLNPSEAPTHRTIVPSSSPTLQPSLSPTKQPTLITLSPTSLPTNPTVAPTATPTDSPTFTPSAAPTKLQIHVQFTENPTEKPTMREAEVESVTDIVSTSVNPEVNDRENEEAIENDQSLLYVFMITTIFFFVCVVICGILVFRHRVKEQKRAALQLGSHAKSTTNKPQEGDHEGDHEGDQGAMGTTVVMQNVQVNKPNASYFEEIASLSMGHTAPSPATPQVDIDGVQFETAIKNLQAVNNALIDDVVDDMADSVDGLEVNHPTPGFEAADDDDDDIELEFAGKEVVSDENVIMAGVTMGGLADDFEINGDEEDEIPPPPPPPTVDTHVTPRSNHLMTPM